MIGLRHSVPVLLGACALGAMMATTPDYNRVFQPFRTHAQVDGIAQGRLHDARFGNWQTADQISFDRYGKAVVRDTQGVFLVVDVDILNVRESVRLTAAWLGRSGRRYEQTSRAEGTPVTLDVRQFHPGLDDRGVVVFELPEDEVAGGQLLLARRGPNILDSELALTPATATPMQHHALLRLGP